MKLPQLVWKKEWTTPALFIGGLVLGAIVTVGTAYALRPDLFSPKSQTPVVQIPDYVPPGPTDPRNPQPAPPVDPLPLLPPDETEAELDVTWHTPKELKPLEVFGAAIRSSTTSVDMINALYKQASSTGLEVWDLATVRDGAYEGSTLLYWGMVDCGLGECLDYHLLRSPDGREIRIIEGSLQAEEYFGINALLSTFISATGLSVPSMSEPPTVTLQNGRLLTPLTSIWTPVTYRDSLNGTIKGLKKVSRSIEGYDLYRAEDAAGCLYVFGSDRKPYAYSSIIPTKIKEGTGIDAPMVNWSTTLKLDAAYTPYVVGGCGIGLCTQLVSIDEMGGLDALQRAGTTSEGDPVYIPKQPEKNLIVLQVYDTWMPMSENGTYATAKPSIDVFLQDIPVPVFFWQDELGRWVRYLSTNAMPPGECGKPVIYLYPEKTTDVSVRLPSFIDVTVSDPSYPTEGWKVTAQPDGKLTDKRDGKQYGSLYWEGTGVGYETPKDGWIIKDGEVEKFLVDTLPRYGLNETETREFMEFWVPEMKGAPYYRVSFLTSAWNKAAPLYVSPRPQSVIRIFMDWRPVSAPTKIAAPVIEPTARDGFTLVEWGGTLYR